MDVKVALCQLNVVEDKTINLENAKIKIQEASEKGAKIVCLPEIFNCLYDNKSFLKNAEPIGGETYQLMEQWAKDNGIFLIGGSIPEKDGAKIYNTCFVFDPQGQCIARHRKVHLFDIEVPGKIKFYESDTFTAGESITFFDTPYGRFGVAICFDIRFPEWFRMMANEGVKGVFLPGAFNMTTGPAHWELALRSRAVDNQIFMFGCAPARGKNGYTSYGNSMGVDPWGNIMGRLEEKQEILLLTIDTDKVDQLREQLPLIKNSRRSLYKL